MVSCPFSVAASPCTPPPPSQRSYCAGENKKTKERKKGKQERIKRNRSLRNAAYACENAAQLMITFAGRVNERGSLCCGVPPLPLWSSFPVTINPINVSLRDQATCTIPPMQIIFPASQDAGEYTNTRRQLVHFNSPLQLGLSRSSGPPAGSVSRDRGCFLDQYSAGRA